MNYKTLVQREISKVVKPTYFDEIPLYDLFQAVSKHGGLVVQEDGSEWSGILCGEQGQTSFTIFGVRGLHYLNVSWYKMPSGRYEVVAYAT